MYKMILSYLISSVFCLHHISLFQEGWVVLISPDSLLVQEISQGQLSPPKKWGGTFRILHILLETASRTWPQRDMQNIALFQGIFLPAMSVPSLIWFIFLFLSLLSLSLLHIISLHHLPDQEGKVIILWLPLILMPYHLKGFFRVMISSLPEIE